MVEAILWFSTLKVAGLASFLVFRPSLRALPDRGYGVAPVAALVVLCWTTWAIGSLGVVPAGRTLALVAFAALIYCGWRAARGRRRAISTFLRAHWPGIVAVETAFVLTFALWVLVASENPSANHTEKPMDFAIMNSIASSDQIPPPDVWLAGHPVVYYYGGHYAAAYISKVTGIPPEFAYNLAVPSVAALTAGALTALVYNIALMSGVRRRTAAILSPLGPACCLLFSNGVGVLEFLSARGLEWEWFWSWVSVNGLPATSSAGLFPGDFWWWWRSTRVIDTVGPSGQSLDYTITEFPMFSFLLGDLHAHVSALPLAALSMTLALVILAARRTPQWNDVRKRPLLAGLVVLTLGTLGFTNPWDFPLYLTVLTLAVTSLCLSKNGIPISLNRITATTKIVAGFAMAIGGAAFLAYLPFWQGFDSQAGGVMPILGHSTRPVHFLLTMGAPAMLSAASLVLMWRDFGVPKGNDRRVLTVVMAVALLPLPIWLVASTLLVGLDPDVAGQVADRAVSGRLMLALPLLAAAGSGAYLTVMLSNRNASPVLRLASLLIATGFLLLAGAELFRVDDQFTNRMNTVFKVYYQAWMLLWVGGLAGCLYCVANGLLPRVALRRRLHRLAATTVVMVLALAALYYPAGAVAERTGWTGPHASLMDNGLSALSNVRQQDPDEYQAIRWLRAQPQGGNIVEAVGNSYSHHGRVSSATGRPTIINWPGHERQWRGEDFDFGGREGVVREIYASNDAVTARQHLERHDVEYIFLGGRERQAYGSEVDHNLQNLVNQAVIDSVFRSGSVTIYRVQGFPTR